jgi:hypothetical protein
MTAGAEALLREALLLPDADSADIVAGLLASLDEAVDDPETVQALWGEELEARAKRATLGRGDRRGLVGRPPAPRPRTSRVSRRALFGLEASAELAEAVRW